MKIWIMRHGEAGFNAPSDSERPLTENGIAAAQKQGEWLAKRFENQQVSLDKILVSPYVRAQQTWAAVQAGMCRAAQLKSFENLSQVVETWEGITPAGSPENVANYLHFLREEGAKNVLIISHLPLVFDLVQTFTQFNASVHFYPATLAEIDWARDCGVLITSERP